METVRMQFLLPMCLCTGQWAISVRVIVRVIEVIQRQNSVYPLSASGIRQSSQSLQPDSADWLVRRDQLTKYIQRASHGFSLLTGTYAAVKVDYLARSLLVRLMDSMEDSQSHQNRGCTENVVA